MGGSVFDYCVIGVVCIVFLSWLEFRIDFTGARKSSCLLNNR